MTKKRQLPPKFWDWLAEWARSFSDGARGSHDFTHTERVVGLAVHIAEAEGADVDVHVALFKLFLIYNLSCVSVVHLFNVFIECTELCIAGFVLLCIRRLCREILNDMPYCDRVFPCDTEKYPHAT